MLTINHATLAAEVSAHIAADQVTQGKYWDGSRGCFIGCLSHSSEAAALTTRFGLPVPLVRLCEHVFEELTAEEARQFFADFPAAVGRDGKDLSRVHWAFLASELRALPKVGEPVQAVIDPVIAGMEALARGDEWASRAASDAAADADTYADTYADADAARAVANAAHAATYDYAAVDAAEAAADAAAYDADDADAAYCDCIRRQRDTLLELVRNAPVVELTQEQDT